MIVSLQNKLPKSRRGPCLLTPRGVKFVYFDQKWPKYWRFTNSIHVFTIKWCKAATFWHLKQIIIQFIQNESPNNREYLSLWPPQGVKYQYFDCEWPQILAFCCLLFNLNHLAGQNRLKNTLKMKHDSLSSKWVTKQ
jgi:hypothetical protein